MAVVMNSHRSEGTRLWMLVSDRPVESSFCHLVAFELS